MSDYWACDYHNTHGNGSFNCLPCGVERLLDTQGRVSLEALLEAMAYMQRKIHVIKNFNKT